MAKGRKTGGRQKGTPNKITGDLRAQLHAALAKVGGVKYLSELAYGNPAAFASLLGRCIPKDVTVDNGGTITITWKTPDQARRAETELPASRSVH